MKTKMMLIILLAITVFIGVSNLAYAQSVDSFKAYNVHGISMAPSVFTSGTPSVYTVTLNPGAYLDFGGETYDITSIFGFYAVGSNFQATGDSFTIDGSEWKWVSGSNTDGAFAGWSNNDKKSKILPGTSREFTFKSMTVSEVPPVMGLHIMVALDDKVSPFGIGNTGYVIPVPEPGGLLALGSGLIGLVGLVTKKRRI